VNVRDWILQHAPAPKTPAALTERMLAFLGDDARRDATEAGEACLSAAVRALETLLQAGRFERDSALDLLAVDALTTFAFAHASERARSERELREFSDDGARRLGRLAGVTLQRV
jgi:uncharacterized membrane protein